MANRLGRAVRGESFSFDGEGQVSSSLPNVPGGDGGAAAAAASLFAGLSQQLGSLADAAAKREGLAEGYAAGEAANPPTVGADGNVVPRGEGAQVPISGALPPEGRQLLAAISSTESPDYNVLNGGERFSSYADHPRRVGKGGTATAAGKYQFVEGTWDRAAKALGLKDFSPENQDKAAWWLAQSDYQSRTGRQLLADLRTPERISEVRRGLTGTWEGLKSLSDEKFHARLGQPVAAGRAAAATSTDAPDIPTYEPPPPPRPLALRSDGTIRGDARDAAAMRVYGAKIESGVRTDTAQAYEDHKDDPAALKARLDEIRASYEADASFDGDPELRAAFHKRFDLQSQAYLKDANARVDLRVDREAKSNTAVALSATRQDLERQAYLLGSNPSGDQNIEAQLGRMDAAVDHAAARGDITPSQRESYRRDARKTIVTAKVKGTFDALPTPEAKAKFADSLVAAWAKKDGPIGTLDRQTVDTLGSQLAAAARSETAQAKAANSVQRQQLARRLDDDVKSIASTGHNLVVDGAELTEAQVADTLGPEHAAKWVADRQRARALYTATADLKLLPADEIAKRLTTLTPAPGSDGYATADSVHDAAAREAARILKQRREDPAAAVDDAFEDVRAAKAALNPQDPATFQTLAAARLDAQMALGIPDQARAPLTDAEAKALIQPFNQAQPGEEYKALNLVLATVQARYGDHADEVATQLLHTTGISKDEAATGYALMKALRSAKKPAPAEARAADVATETSKAERALSQPSPPPRGPQAYGRGAPAAVAGRPPAAAKPAAQPAPTPIPNYAQIQMLLKRPDLRSTFEAKFGPGSADYYTSPSKPAPADDDQ